MKLEQKRQIEQLLDRAKHVHYFGDAGKTCIAQMEVLLGKSDKDSPEAKEYGELVRRAHMGDIDAQTAMHELVIKTTTNFLTATMNFGRFFEMNTLAENQSPVIVNNTRMQVSITYLSQEGQPRYHKVVRPYAETLVDLYILASEWVWYHIRDIYTGDVSEAARVMFDITYDLKAKLEDVLKAVVFTGIGAFDVTNANKVSRAYVASDRFQAGVLPTTNDVNIVGIGANSTFDLKLVADQIVNYAVRFAGSDPSGDLRPTGELIVPAMDIIEVSTGITLVGGVGQSSVADEMLLKSWLDLPSIWGVNWRVIPDNTIPSGALYAVLNKPLGMLWMKPSFSTVEEVIERAKNRARRMESLCFGAALTSVGKRNILKVNYRT